MNIDAGFLGTCYRLRGRFRTSPRVDHVPKQQISILLNGTRLISKFDKCIRYHINGYHLRQYIQEMQGWDNKVWELVDFRSFGKYFCSLQPTRQVTHMKVVHGQHPQGTQRLQQAPIQDTSLSLCPCRKRPYTSSLVGLTLRSRRAWTRFKHPSVTPMRILQDTFSFRASNPGH